MVRSSGPGHDHPALRRAGWWSGPVRAGGQRQYLATNTSALPADVRLRGSPFERVPNVAVSENLLVTISPPSDVAATARPSSIDVPPVLAAHCQAPAEETFATNPSSLPADVSDVEPNDAVPAKFPVTIARPPAPDAAASLR